MFSVAAAILRSLVLPAGTTSGTRIVLDGVNGRISIFDSTDVEIIRLDSLTGWIVAGDIAGSGDRAIVDGADGTVTVTDSSGKEIMLDPSAAGYPTIYFNRGGYGSWVSAPTNGEVEVSADPADGSRTRLRVAPTTSTLAYLDSSDVVQGGYIVVDADEGTISTVSGGVYQTYVKTTDTAIEVYGDIAHSSGSGMAEMNVPACRVKRTSTQSFSHATVTTVLFNSEVFDTESLHDTVTNSSRITASRDGIYHVGVHGLMQSGSDYTRMYAIIKVNGTEIARQDQYPNGATMFAPAFSLTTSWLATTGDYFEVDILQANSATAARNLVVNAGQSPHFWATYQGTGG